MFKGHTYLAWYSTAAGLLNIILAFPFSVIGTDWTIRLITLSVLGITGMITGLISRFGRARDNLGAAGIVLAITALLVCFYVLLNE